MWEVVVADAGVSSWHDPIQWQQAGLLGGLRVMALGRAGVGQAEAALRR